MKFHDCLSLHAAGTVVAVMAQPRASRDGVAGMHGNELKVRVAKPPVDDAANDGLRKFLAKLLGLRASEVELLHGRSSRHKKFLVRGLSPETVAERLRDAD
jgi:uncharacterized protein (TIGR00251 family)